MVAIVLQRPTPAMANALAGTSITTATLGYKRSKSLAYGTWPSENDAHVGKPGWRL